MKTASALLVRLSPLVAAMALAAIVFSCGGSRKLPAVPPSSDWTTGVPARHSPAPPASFKVGDPPPFQAAENWGAPPFQAATLSGTTLSETLSELDALPTPEGVDETLFSQLKEALRDALQDTWTTGVPPVGTGETRVIQGEEKKLVSSPPTGEANRVDDLELIDLGDGTYTLTWSYVNVGDYNQDGIVDIKDITPLAVHFNEAVDETNEWIDGNADSVINIQDITPLAAHFFCDVAGYEIEGATVGGDFSTFKMVDFPVGAWHAMPLQLEHTFSAGEAGALARFRVVPVDSWGELGIGSNEVELPVSAPEIHSVAPTEWYTGEECTFTAAVSGTRPLNFSWDFGGGAEPNEVTGSGDEVIAEVALGEPGEYAASLTVGNLYGEDAHPFTLRVAERESWAHTWGGHDEESVAAVAADSEGAIYVAGGTRSFGAGRSDVLLLKYAPSGEVIWARAWGGSNWDVGRSVAVDASGSIYVCGNTDSFGAGYYDVLLLKYDSDGNLLWSKVWGGQEPEFVGSMTSDLSGNVYICGYTASFGYTFGPSFIVKYDPTGKLLWNKVYMGYIGSIAFSADNAIYAAGEVWVSPESGHAALHKLDSDGSLIWSVDWGAFEQSTASSMALCSSGDVFVVGYTRIPAFQGSGFLLRLDATGSLICAKEWEQCTPRSVFAGPWGCILVTGEVWKPGLGGRVGFVLKYDPDGGPLLSKGWIAQSTLVEGRAMAVDNMRNVYLAGYSYQGALGSWRDIEWEQSALAGQVSPSGIGVETVAGTESVPEGIETSPEGVIDTGAGLGEVMLLKNFPR